MQSGSYILNFGSKGQRSTFRRLSGCTYFLTGYQNTSCLVLMKETCPQSFRTNSSIKVSKDRCPKALDAFADICVLCQVEHFTFAFRYQFLVIFLCFGIFPFDRTSFFTFIIPGSRDIVQVVQTVRIHLQKVRFTAPGSNLAFVLKNIGHNFYKMQKGDVIAFYKIIH